MTNWPLDLVTLVAVDSIGSLPPNLTAKGQWGWCEGVLMVSVVIAFRCLDEWGRETRCWGLCGIDAGLIYLFFLKKRSRNADEKSSVKRKRLQLCKRKRIVIAESAWECGWGWDAEHLGRTLLLGGRPSLLCIWRAGEEHLNWEIWQQDAERMPSNDFCASLGGRGTCQRMSVGEGYEEGQRFAGNVSEVIAL